MTLNQKALTAALWVPNKDYANEETWPPFEHPLYGMFHEARLDMPAPWARGRYERIVDWLASLPAPEGIIPLTEHPESGNQIPTGRRPIDWATLIDAIGIDRVHLAVEIIEGWEAEEDRMPDVLITRLFPVLNRQAGPAK